MEGGSGVRFDDLSSFSFFLWGEGGCRGFEPQRTMGQLL